MWFFYNLRLIYISTVSNTITFVKKVNLSALTESKDRLSFIIHLFIYSSKFPKVYKELQKDHMKIKTDETNINTQKLKGEKGDGQKWTNISNGRVVYSVFLFLSFFFFFFLLFEQIAHLYIELSKS